MRNDWMGDFCTPDTGFMVSGVHQPGMWYQHVACRSSKQGEDTVLGSMVVGWGFYKVRG